MNDYQNKGIKTWTVKDSENYFKDILADDGEEKLRVITSKELTDEEDLDLQCLIGKWYFKDNLKRHDDFVEDLLKTVKFHTNCNDFLLHIYIPVGNEGMCFGIKFDAIVRSGIIQIGLGSFQECLLKGINNYLVNDESAKSMIIIKGFDTTKVISHIDADKMSKFYEQEIFHFVIENNRLHGVSSENAAHIQEQDLTTQEYLGKEIGAIYKETYNLVAEFEVDKLMHEVGIYLLNH